MVKRTLIGLIIAGVGITVFESYAGSSHFIHSVPFLHALDMQLDYARQELRLRLTHHI